MTPTASIVCGIDHSPGARAAAGFAAELADRLDLRLVLVHAVQPVLVAVGSRGHETLDEHDAYEAARVALRAGRSTSPLPQR